MKSVILSLFELSNQSSKLEIGQAIANQNYSDDRGFGFEQIDILPDLVVGILIKRQLTFVYDYNPVDKALVKKPVTLFSEIPLEIDLALGLISVFGPASYMPSVRLALRHTLTTSYTIHSTGLSPVQIYLALKEKGINVSVRSLSIDHFVYEEGISGKLSGQVLDEKVAENLFDRYKTDVCQAQFLITTPDAGLLSLQVSANGGLKFNSPEEVFTEHYHFFKQTLFQ